MEKIELFDEMGNKQIFELIDTFGMDDSEYVVLIPDNDINSLTYILRMEYTLDGEVNLVSIEDDDEFQDAIDVYEELKKKKLQ